MSTLQSQLEHAVRIRSGKLTISDTCVNVSFRNGSFIMTPCYNTLDQNLAECLQFTNECGRVGGVFPVERPSISNFGEIVGKVIKLRDAQEEGYEMGCLISAEFTPAPDERELDTLLEGYGLTVDSYYEELSRRVKTGYRLHCLLRR